jgi:hypothetical protein
MKVLARSIDMIAWFNEEGHPTPIKFKIKTNEDTDLVIKIDKIFFKETEKISGSIIYIYRCQSLVDDALKIYELKYELSSCKWMLYKM